MSKCKECDNYCPGNDYYNDFCTADDDGPYDDERGCYLFEPSTWYKQEGHYDDE